MNRNELKDKILHKAYGRGAVSAQGIEGNPDDVQSAIMELHNEGLIRILHKGNDRGKVTVKGYEITDRGTELVDHGGYAKTKRKLKRAKLSNKVWYGIWFVIGTAANELIHRLISLLWTQ